MLVRDIDRKLDMRLILKLRQNTDFFKATADLNMSLPVYIFGRDNTVWMSTYFPKSSKTQKTEIITRKFGGVEKEDSFVVDSRINNVKDLAVISRLMDVPSFVVNRSDMGGGYLNVYARFHSSQIAQVSNLLAEYTADSENARVSWLGPSMGIMKITDLINSHYPVSLVTYRVPLGKGDEELAAITREPGVIAEVRNSLSRNGKISAILYCDHPIDTGMDNIQEISSKDGICMVEVSNDFYNMVREMANSQHIMRTRYFIKPHGDEIEVNVFLPSSSVYEYYSILYEIARKHNNNVVVSSLMPYSPEVWDFV